MAKRTSVGEYQAALKKLSAMDGPPPVCVVTGGQEYFRREAVRAVVKSVKAVYPEVGVASFQGPATQGEQNLSENEVVGELTSYGLFASQKLVLVRHAQRFLFPPRGGDDESKSSSKQDMLADYVASPTDGMFLLLECESLDRRTKRGKALVKHSLIIDCPELRYDRDTLPWLQQTARHLGISITPDAAEMLYTIHGSDPGTLKSELDKFTLFAEDTGQIDGDAVRAFMGDSLALSIFELSNAIEARDSRRALAVTRRMIRQGITDQRGKKVDTVGTVHMAMGSLRTCLQTLWTAHDVAARGGGVKELEPHLGNRAWRARELYKAGQSYTLHEIRTAYDSICTALSNMHDTGGDPAQSLERVVLGLCRKGN